MSQDVYVRVRGVVKRFGRVVALDGVGFSVSRGEIYCIVGPNGAGKTTTLRIVAGILEPDSGSVELFGSLMGGRDSRVRSMISYLPEDAGVYRNITGAGYLRFIARLYLGGGPGVEEAVEYGARLSGLGRRLEERAGGYSKGMKRRLLVAAALMVRPRLAILDEPTAGLDVRHALVVRRIIREYVKGGEAAAIVSSHNMLEVEYLCDRVSLMHAGRIVEEGDPEGLKSRHGAENLEEVFVRSVGGLGAWE